MEVTEALELNDGRKHSVINQYFGKNLSGKDIKKQFREKHLEYDSQLNVANNTAYFYDFYDIKYKIQQIPSAIVTKAEELNNRYAN